MAPAKVDMKEALNGVFWTKGAHHCVFPGPGDIRKALAFFRKNIVPITWHTLRTFENHPAAPDQTAAILAGHSVAGLSLYEQMQVKNYGDGCRLLADLLSRGTFSLSVETACALHAIVGREDALEWGVLRSSRVFLHHIDHVPPVEHLESLIQTGLGYLSKDISDPCECPREIKFVQNSIILNKVCTLLINQSLSSFQWASRSFSVISGSMALNRMRGRNHSPCPILRFVAFCIPKRVSSSRSS